MAEGAATAGRYDYLRGEWGPYNNRVRHVIKQGPYSMVALTGPQLLGLTTTLGRRDVVIGEETDWITPIEDTGPLDWKIIELIVWLNRGGSSNYRTRDLTVELNYAPVIEGWTAYGSVDEIHWTQLTRYRDGNNVVFRHPDYEPIVEGDPSPGMGTCTGQSMMYQYYRVRYDYEYTDAAQSIKRIAVTPYTMDSGIGTDFCLSTHFGYRAGEVMCGGNFMGAEPFCYIINRPGREVCRCDPDWNATSLQCFIIGKEDTTGISEVLYVGVVRLLGPDGWKLIDLQPLSKGNRLPVAMANDHVLFTTLPVGDVQENDKLIVMGYGCRLAYTATGTLGDGLNYIGHLDQPWKHLEPGDVIPASHFEESDVVPCIRACGCNLAGYWFDDYGEDECGYSRLPGTCTYPYPSGWPPTSSAYLSGGVSARYEYHGDSIQLFIMNSATAVVTEREDEEHCYYGYHYKKFMVDFATGPRIALTAGYTPTGTSEGKIYLEDVKGDVPPIPWETGDPPEMYLAAPGKGYLVTQADGDAATTTEYYFKWDTIVKTGDGAPYLTGLTWFSDMRCEGEGAFDYEPATGAIAAGSLLVNVPYGVEISDQRTPTGDWFKPGDPRLPIVFDNGGTGYAPEEYVGQYDEECWVRWSLDEVPMYQDGRWPLEVIAIEAVSEIVEVQVDIPEEP